MSNADLVKRMRATLVEWACDEPCEDWWAYQRDHADAADRIAALEAEVARLTQERDEAAFNLTNCRAESRERAAKAWAAEARAKALKEALRQIADGATSTYEDGWCGDIAREALEKE